MAHKKIKFTTLQRLDLKDANELQQGVIDKLSTLVKASDVHAPSSAFRNGGVITKQTVQGVANGVVTFGPMNVITAEADEVISLNQTDVDSGLTQCDISALHATYVTQESQGASLTGIYFYAYPLEEDTDVESREFYNTIESIPENRSVVTRQIKRLNIVALINQPSYSVADANGKQPIYLGKVLHANISLTNSNSPFVPSNFKSGNYFTSLYGDGENWDDTDLPNAGENSFTGTDNLSDGNSYSGLKLIFQRLERQLNRIASYGTNDRADTETLALNVRPRYSLQGLYREMLYFDNLLNTNLTAEITRLDDTRKSATIYYEFLEDPVTGVYSHNSFKSDADNDFDVDLTFNWQLIDDEGRLSFPQSLPAIGGDPIAVQMVYSNVVLTLPDAYLGKKIVSCTCTPIQYGLTGGGVDSDGNIDRSVQDRWPECGRVVPADVTTYNGLNYVQNLTWVTQNGTNDSGPALFFKVGPKDAFTTGSGNHFGIQFHLVIDTYEA